MKRRCFKRYCLCRPPQDKPVEDKPVKPNKERCRNEEAKMKLELAKITAELDAKARGFRMPGVPEERSGSTFDCLLKVINDAKSEDEADDEATESEEDEDEVTESDEDEDEVMESDDGSEEQDEVMEDADDASQPKSASRRRRTDVQLPRGTMRPSGGVSERLHPSTICKRYTREQLERYYAYWRGIAKDVELPRGVTMRPSGKWVSEHIHPSTICNRYIYLIPFCVFEPCAVPTASTAVLRRKFPLHWSLRYQGGGRSGL